MQAILIVEEDESIRRILDLSLRHAGFAVGLASNNEEALKRLADGPDLVIAGAIDAEALAFCRRVKQTGDRLPPAVVLISDPGIESKTRGLEAGADDFVVKPIYVQEVVARARALLQRRERERLELSAHAAGAATDGAEAPASRGDRFVSDISDVPLVDLLRAIAAHQKSGVAVITADGGARGDIFFRQGNVVDAEVGRLSGRDAIYRLFCWSTGHLEVEWKSIRRKDTIEMRPQDLLMEALRRVDEWRRLLAGLPPLDTIFEVDYRTLAERLADIPDEVNRILRLFDGVRTFLQVIDDCGLPDLDAAASIGQLVQERIIHDIRLQVGEDEAVGADMEGWLSEATGPFRSPARLERDLFGASPEAGIGVHGRPTAPLEPLDGAPDPLDEDLRARFTDRLAAEGHPPEVIAVPAAPTRPGMPGFPNTLPGFGVAESRGSAGSLGWEEGSERSERSEGARAAMTMAAVAVPTALESSLEAAVSGRRSFGGGGLVEEMSKPEISSPNAEDAILSSEDAILSSDDATPIMDVASMDGTLAPTSPGTEPPASVAAALPVGPEQRSASGEIVVRPAKTKIKHSPAAEVRLAHLREENARAFVREENARSFIRPSQSVTPPGSARALDEPPPLLDGPAPEPLPRATTQLVRATAVEAEVNAADELSEPGLPEHHRGALIAVLVTIAVCTVGGMLLVSRHHSPQTESGAGEMAAQSQVPAPAPASVPPASLPVVAPAGTGAAAAVSAKPAGAAAVVPAHDEAEERTADPKLARARLAEAPALLVACRTSYQEARMKDAEAVCTAARDANPDSAEANGWLAHALLNRNHRRESLVAAERAVKLNPKWADAYVVIGGIHQDAGEMADARRAYQRYLELQPHGEFAVELRAIVDRLGKL
jgi:CheY-like chemotaxis protein